jgi:hypothetical protein
MFLRRLKLILKAYDYTQHAAYPAVSVSRKLLTRTPQVTPPQINVIAASRAGSQSEALFEEFFNGFFRSLLNSFL